MPIQKRKIIKPLRDPSELGIPVQSLVAKYDKLASDADWKGKKREARRHTRAANTYREKLRLGTYYVKHDAFED